MPEDLSLALPFIEKVSQAFNVPILKLDGYEADDIIGTLAKKPKKMGLKWFTWSRQTKISGN